MCRYLWQEPEYFIDIYVAAAIPLLVYTVFGQLKNPFIY